MQLLKELEDASRGKELRTQHNSVDTRYGFTFRFGNFNLIIPFVDGLKIMPNSDVRPLPFVREWVSGLIYVNREIYTVIDFPHFLGFTPAKLGTQPHLLLLTGHTPKNALLLDSTPCLKEFTEHISAATTPENSHCQAPPILAASLKRHWIADNQGWGLLDWKVLLHSKEFTDITQPATTTTQPLSMLDASS